MLLKECLCGRANGLYEKHGPVLVRRCACGVCRQETDQTLEAYGEQYTDGSYHESSARHEGCLPYADRYANDYRVAGIRLKRYFELVSQLARLPQPLRVLDVGAANGAFVDYCANLGCDAWGLDPHPVVDPLQQARTLTGTLDRVPPALIGKRFDLITMHDVLEHLVDPKAELQRARAFAAPGGVIVIDVPDVSVPEGQHHFKPEHLWYYSTPALIELLARARFEPIAVDAPIAGKLVMYGGAV